MTDVILDETGSAAGSGVAGNSTTLVKPTVGQATANGTVTSAGAFTHVSRNAGHASGSATASAVKPFVSPTGGIPVVVVEVYDPEIVLPWWNSSYLFRRELIIDNLFEDVVVDHILEWEFSPLTQYLFGKARSDYEDFEIIHKTDTKIPVFTVLPREVTDEYIRFPLLENLSKGGEVSGTYYAYFGNWELDRTPERPEYEEDLWPNLKTPSSINVTYTRPEQYWDNGVASDPRAVATIGFYGARVRITSEKGPEAGIAQASIDGGSWADIDLYSPTTSIEVVFEVTNLTETKHQLRIRATGKSNATSQGNNINFVSVEYLTPITVSHKNEEIMNVDWRSVMSGMS